MFILGVFRIGYYLLFVVFILLVNNHPQTMSIPYQIKIIRTDKNILLKAFLVGTNCAWSMLQFSLVWHDICSVPQLRLLPWWRLFCRTASPAPCGSRTRNTENETINRKQRKKQPGVALFKPARERELMLAICDIHCWVNGRRKNNFACL